MWSFLSRYWCLRLPSFSPHNAFLFRCILSVFVRQSPSVNCQSKCEWWKKGKIEQNCEQGAQKVWRVKRAHWTELLFILAILCVYASEQVLCFFPVENADLRAYYFALSPTSRIRPHWQGVFTHCFSPLFICKTCWQQKKKWGKVWDIISHTRAKMDQNYPGCPPPLPFCTRAKC